MKVVTEFLPNERDHVREEAEAWYQEALKFMQDNAGQWVMVDEDPEFHKGRLHKLKFKLFNEGSGNYETEFRYPENKGCVMYGRWPEAVPAKVKRWFGK